MPAPQLYYRLKQGGLPPMDSHVARFICNNPACDAALLAEKMAKDSHDKVGRVCGMARRGEPLSMAEPS
jgi:hypothetical protein